MYNLKIKQITGASLEFEIDPDDITVFDLKQLIEIEWPEVDSDIARLVHRGKILKNNTLLCNVKNLSSGDTLVITKSKKKKKQKPVAPQQPTTNNSTTQQQQQQRNQQSTTFSQPPTTNTQNPNFLNFGNMSNMFQTMNQNQGTRQGSNPQNMQNMQQNMQQQLMQNPEMMQQMMENPMVRSMMDQMMQNPNVIQNLFESNPQLREMLDANPQIRQVLRDPETLQQAMRAATNPEYYQEMLRNQDRALANISNMPGGFNALSRMYNSVQAPMEEALYGMTENQVETSISAVDTSTGPNSSAMPNPWASNNNNNNNNNRNVRPRQNNTRQNQNPRSNPQQMSQFMNMMRQQQQQQQQQQRLNNPLNQQASRQRFAIQLTTLRNQGFTNENDNLNALAQTNGNVELAMRILRRNQQSTN